MQLDMEWRPTHLHTDGNIKWIQDLGRPGYQGSQVPKARKSDSMQHHTLQHQLSTVN